MFTLVLIIKLIAYKSINEALIGVFYEFQLLKFEDLPLF